MAVAFAGFGGGWVKALSGPAKLFAALIGIAAFAALLRYNAGIIPVIGVCSLAGLLYILAKPLL